MLSSEDFLALSHHQRHIRAVGTGGAWGTIAPPHQDFGKNRSRTFSFKRPLITTCLIFRPSYGLHIESRCTMMNFKYVVDVFNQFVQKVKKIKALSTYLVGMLGSVTAMVASLD